MGNHEASVLDDGAASDVVHKQRDVDADGAATAVFVCRGATGVPVTTAIRVTARGEGFSVAARTAPARTWRKLLDGGTSREMLRYVLRAADRRP